MSFKEQLKKSCKEIKSSAISFADNVKLEYKKNQLKKELAQLHETLGQVRYAELLDNGETTDESIKLCTEIGRVLSEISDLSQADAYEKKCGICKKKVPAGVTYCPYCGTKIEE